MTLFDEAIHKELQQQLHSETHHWGIYLCFASSTLGWNISQCTRGVWGGLGEWGGGVGMSPWYVVLAAAGRAYWLIAIGCPSLGPFPSIGGGAHQPLTTLCPSSSSLLNFSVSTSLCFPLVSCANGARGLSLFQCSLSGPQRGGQLPLLLARCIQAVIPKRQCGTQWWLATCGVYSPPAAHNNLLPVHSRTHSSLWRAHHVPPIHPFMTMVCVLCALCLFPCRARGCAGWRVA